MLGLRQNFKRLDQGRTESGLYLRIEAIHQAGGGNPTGAISQKERGLGVPQDEPCREGESFKDVSSFLQGGLIAGIEDWSKQGLQGSTRDL